MQIIEDHCRVMFGIPDTPWRRVVTQLTRTPIGFQWSNGLWSYDLETQLFREHTPEKIDNGWRWKGVGGWISIPEFLPLIGLALQRLAARLEQN